MLLEVNVAAVVAVAAVAVPVLTMFQGQVRMAHADGLADAVLETWEGCPVGTGVAGVDGCRARQRLAVALGHQGHDAGVGPEVAGVDDVT